MTDIAAPPAPVPAPAPPAPAPVAPPAPAPVAPPAPEPQAPPVVALNGFEPTGDAGIDLALGFFGKLGLKESDPEIAEAGKGNFEYLKAKLASMGAKAVGYEQYLALAEKGYNDFHTSQNTAREARVKLVQEAVGGEENWNAIQTWAEKEGTPEELAQFKAGIKQGGVVAQAVAKFLAEQYAAASSTTLNPAAVVDKHANVVAAQPVNLAGYHAEVRALQAKLGSEGVQSSPEYAALRQKYASLSR